MEISPVSVDQVQAGRDGRQYLIEGSAGLVAKRLHDIDPTLKVYFNERGNFFAVAQVVPDGPKKGEESLVMRVPMDEWDERVVLEMQMRNYELRNGINPADRLDALDRKAAAEKDYAFDQDVRSKAEPLMRAIQKDIGFKPRIFVPAARRTKDAA